MVTVAATGAPHVGQHRRHVAIMTQNPRGEQIALGAGAISGSVASMERLWSSALALQAKHKRHTHTHTSMTKVWLDVDLPSPWSLCRWECGVGVLLLMEMLLALFSASSGQS